MKSVSGMQISVFLSQRAMAQAAQPRKLAGSYFKALSSRNLPTRTAECKGLTHKLRLACPYVLVRTNVARDLAIIISSLEVGLQDEFSGGILTEV